MIYYECVVMVLIFFNYLLIVKNMYVFMKVIKIVFFFFKYKLIEGIYLINIKKKIFMLLMDYF